MCSANKNIDIAAMSPNNTSVTSFFNFSKWVECRGLGPKKQDGVDQGQETDFNLS